MMNFSSRTVLLPSIVLLIGAVFGTTATNAFAADDPFKNKVAIDTNVDNKNTCDETGEGHNQAVCAITDNLETSTFTMQGEKNKIQLMQREKTITTAMKKERGTMKVFVQSHQTRKSGK